jgi:hypothetical protein
MQADEVTHSIGTPLFSFLIGLLIQQNHQFGISLHLFIVGIVITLPQRVIAAEGKLDYVKEKGERKLDLSFWLDKKRQPDNKAGVYVLVAVNPTKDGTTLQGEVKFSHPDLQKVMKENCT